MAWTARGAEDVTMCCISTTVVPWTDHLGGGKRGGRAVVGAHDGCYMCCSAGLYALEERCLVLKRWLRAHQ